MMGLIQPLIFFPIYEQSKIYFKNNYEDPKAEILSPKYLISSSIFAKLIASTIAYPHEVVRSRMQYEKASEDKRKENVFNILKRIVKKEGFQGLYSGFSINLTKGIPSSILYFLVYENLCYQLGVDNSGQKHKK